MSTTLHAGETARRQRHADPINELVLRRLGDGRLEAERGSDSRHVWVRRCFPWSEPTRYISLRDQDDNEFALIGELSQLQPASRRALELALAEAGFVLEIVRVLEIDEQVEIRHWKVQTRQGPRSFQTRLDDWPRELPGGGLLIRDVAGDLYYVADPAALDRQSRELLWVFVD